MLNADIKSTSENLLLCLRQDARQEKISRLNDFTLEQWEDIIEQARRHNLIAILFWELNILTPDFEIPEEIRLILRQDSLQSAQNNMRLYLELKPVLQALNESGIPAILLKGAHLAALIYPDLSLRPMGDIDLMVPKEKLEAAARVLEELDYQPTQFYEIEPILSLRHHLPPFWKPNFYHIEVHWLLFPPTYPFTLDLDGLWQRAQPETIYNTPTTVLSSEDLLLHLCIHATYQHQFAFGLRALYDITVVLNHFKGEIDWDQVLSLTQVWGAQKSIFITLKTCMELLNTPIPMHILDSLRPADFKEEMSDMIRTYTIDPPIEYSNNFITLFESEPTGKKVRHALGRVFPPRQSMAIKYGIPWQSPKIFLYYPYRLFIILRDNLRKVWQVFRRDPEFLSLVREKSDILKLINWLET